MDTPQLTAREMYANVHQMVRQNNLFGGSDQRVISQRNEDYLKKADQIKDQRPVLVYEEITHDDSEPRKFYGYKDKFMSANESSKVPNYALMIYDVSMLFG